MQRIRAAVLSMLAACALASCATTTAGHDAAAKTNAGAKKDTGAKKNDARPPTVADYRRFSKGSALAFPASRVEDWTSPDPNHVVVWTSPFEAYLLTLMKSCFNLQTAHTIVLSAQGGVTATGGGAVLVAGERCPIQNVERLDARAMKAAGVH